MMYSSKSGLLSTTVIPMVVMAGVAVGGAVVTGQVAPQPAYAACNPCAVAKCNPCNPCAAAKCNPCAAAKCNPCAAAKCNPCNPFNPCAAACNPCNPCGAGSGGKAALKCAVPRLRTAALCNPCNPCAAANPCNPCNPCGAGAAPELTAREAAAAYDCLVPLMKAAYAKSDNDIALSYGSWRRYSNNAYVSATHGGRYVQNFADDKAEAYGLYERSGTFPVGAQLAKPSFGVKGNGAVSVGPLFIMEKMPAGFNKPSDDWRYTMIMPNGSVFGATKGNGAQNVEFCIGCHQSVTPEQDSVMLMPEEVRVK